MKNHWRYLRYLFAVDFIQYYSFVNLIFQTFQDKCDSAGEDEENVVTVKVTKDMSPQDVIKKTMDMLSRYSIEIPSAD